MIIIAIACVLYFLRSPQGWKLAVTPRDPRAPGDLVFVVLSTCDFRAFDRPSTPGPWGPGAYSTTLTNAHGSALNHSCLATDQCTITRPAVLARKRACAARVENGGSAKVRHSRQQLQVRDACGPESCSTRRRRPAPGCARCVPRTCWTSASILRYATKILFCANLILPYLAATLPNKKCNTPGRKC